MGFLFSSSIFLLSSFFGFSPVITEVLREGGAFCNAEGCFVIYFEDKIFLDSWRSCKEKGGNLATIKRKEDASAIARLFSTLDLQDSHAKVRVWIGLQRQPRQCSSHPLRGFTWTIGDQDTEYTNWQSEDSPSMCLVPRCVAIGYNTQEHSDNFLWIDYSCSVRVDGYLCHYAYKGMCSTLSSEHLGNIHYTTPFNFWSTILTHVPVGSIANISCPTNANKNELVLCILRQNGSVAWSREPPFCSVPSIPHRLCEQDNGGCEHFCRQTDGQIFCDCTDGFHLRYDRLTCEPDVCQGNHCESQCLPLSNGYRCACPDGYILATDTYSCLDVDECLESPCQQICKNLPGTFECQCWGGFLLNEKDVCEDIDECLNDLCDHSCKNIPGSYTCYCQQGFSIDTDEPRRCHDNDECQIAGICEQMCRNYMGGFECFCKEGYELLSDNFTCQKIGEGQIGYVTPSFSHLHQHKLGWNPVLYSWNPEKSSDDWPVNQEQPFDRLTNPSAVSTPEEVWVTSPSQDKLSSHSETKRSEQDEEAVHVLDWEQQSQLEINVLSTTQTIISSTTSSNTMSESYKDDGEDVTTTIALLSTSTVSEGAWNSWPGFSASTQSLENPTVPHTDSYIKKEAEQETYFPRDYSQFPGQQSGREGRNFGKITHSEGTVVPTEFSTPKPLPPFLNEGGRHEDNLDSVQDDMESKQSNIGLLVGLLVSTCVFIVVMVAIGIFYCTHCGVKPRNENTTKCYHWICGAHDKQSGPRSLTGDDTPV